LYTQILHIGRHKAIKRFIHDKQNQDFYNNYNEFVFSNDRKIFNKLVSKTFFIEQTKGIPGEIVELGVFKGAGMAAWLKTLNSFGIQNKNCIGFDIFDVQLLKSNISTIDNELMQKLFNQRQFDPTGYDLILREKLEECGFDNFDIISGDVFDTIPKYLSDNPGFRASLVNFDLDTAEPTYFCLDRLWERVVKGGILIFDEYAINEWTESDAVDRFVKEKDLQIQRSMYQSPSAYIVK